MGKRALSGGLHVIFFKLRSNLRVFYDLSFCKYHTGRFAAEVDGVPAQGALVTLSADLRRFVS
jgi:hypothetical protein